MKPVLQPPPGAPEGPTLLDGVDLEEGTRRLRELVAGIHWLDRSAALLGALGGGLPPVRHSLVSELVPCCRPPRPPGDGPGAGSSRPPGGHPEPAPGRLPEVCVAFAPEHSRSAHDWATANGLPLLAADAAVTATAGDKIKVLDLFGAATVRTPGYAVVPPRERPAARDYWKADWSAAVVQRRENNSTGQGTRLVRGPEELQACMDAWPGASLRVARFVDGVSLAVSACVTGGAVVVSAVTQQLVGLPATGSRWGAHCGNQLLNAGDLPGSAYRAAREATRRIGERLRGAGYRGAYGVDFVLDGEQPLAVEINPRFQTVVALAQRAEAEAGLLPMLGLHVLACLQPSLPVRTVSTSVRPWSQLLSYADRDLEATPLPAPGRYVLDAGGRPRRLDDGTPARPGPGEALLWAQRCSAHPVACGDELMLAQFAERVAAVSPDPVLAPRARAWVEALRPATVRAAT
ncbi:ATP-grasp domain-containing protein [Streptomyces sp. URMC 123]|uniref:ATP-grasp domain-containing protein n=1 Tax=Streptomyces sp. URMC 123 TaxID=3423403 RepID=UPI003F19E9C5